MVKIDSYPHGWQIIGEGKGRKKMSLDSTPIPDGSVIDMGEIRNIKRKDESMHIRSEDLRRGRHRKD